MDYLNLYAQFLKNNCDLKKALKVIFDCSNGTTGKVLKELFRKSNKSHKTNRTNRMKMILINSKPNGNFPAHGPNPMIEGAMEELGKKIVKEKADLGVSFDSDGDRAFFVDNLGRPIRSDVVALFIARGIRGAVVLDLLAGYPIQELLKDRKIFESRVGSYFMKKIMKEKKAKFGAENSGHFYFPVEGAVFDSGILAAIYFMNRLSRMSDGKLSDWIDFLPKYYRSPEINFEIEDKSAILKIVEERYAKDAKAISHLDGLKMEFENYWFCLRPSNTENLLRLNLEAKNKTTYNKKLAELKQLLK